MGGGGYIVEDQLHRLDVIATVQHGGEKRQDEGYGCALLFDDYDFELDAFFSSVLLGMPSPNTIWPLAWRSLSSFSALNTNIDFVENTTSSSSSRLLLVSG